MKGISEVYIKSMREHFNLCPNWEPHNLVSLGDYGTITDGIFNRLDNINKRFGIELVSQPVSAPVRREFSTEGVRSRQLNTGASTEVANAQVEIMFEKENGVFFNAPQCVIHRIDNLGNVLDELLELYKQGKWDTDWVVVSELEEAQSAVIAVSREANASIAFEAATPIAKIDLADANLKLKAAKADKIAYKLDASDNHATLIVMMKLQRLRKKGLLGMGKRVEWSTERSIADASESEDIAWVESAE